MRILKLLAMVLVALLVGQGVAQAATFESTDKWAGWSNGGYTVHNNVWGSGAGPQSIWANSYRSWGVWSNQPNTGGVKSYPHVAKSVQKRLSTINTLTSTFAVTRPNAGAYNSAYDIWTSGNAYEIMVWMNKQGAVGPIGTKRATATVGGHTWDFYSGSNGSNTVYSFIRTSNTNSGTVDLKAVLNWLRTNNYYGDVTIDRAEFGWEISSSSGGYNFAVTNYGVTLN